MKYVFVFALDLFPNPFSSTRVASEIMMLMVTHGITAGTRIYGTHNSCRHDGELIFQHKTRSHGGAEPQKNSMANIKERKGTK